MWTPTKTMATRAAMGPMIVATLLASPVARPVHAQSIICCNQNIAVGGAWTGSSRISDCQDYFNKAPTSLLRRMCQQRAALLCINTARCSELPPEETAAPDPAEGSAALPPDPDRDGLEEGFYGLPPPEPSLAPAAPPTMPRRLVYIAAWGQKGDTQSKTFSVWLDRVACPLPLDQNNRLAESAAARHVVRGKVIRRDGRVKIEAEAQERPGGAKLGPFTGEAEGDDTAAARPRRREARR
jgi:hypothetical protein